MTAVWTTPRTGHSPCWTLCCCRGAATGPSPPSTPAARQVTRSPRAQGLSPPLPPFRKASSTDGTHATAAWTPSHQSSAATSRLSEEQVFLSFLSFFLGLFFHVIEHFTPVSLLLSVFLCDCCMRYFVARPESSYFKMWRSLMCRREALFGLELHLPPSPPFPPPPLPPPPPPRWLRGTITKCICLIVRCVT